MSRQLSSFLLTVLAYTIAGAALFMLTISSKQTPAPEECVIKVALITPAPVVKPEPEPVPEPEPEPAPEPEPKPEPEPVPEPKPEPELAPEPEPVPEPKPEPKPKPKPKKIIKKSKPKPLERKVRKKSTSASASKSVTANLKQKFLGRVRSTIIRNKKYPRAAIKRNIQGRVRVSFDIQKNGTVSNIRVSGASPMLQRAAKKSIRRSFPVAVPKKLKGEMPLRNVSINLDFKLK
ncbi:MAG: energy transducer TonB [Campylobacterota bacterium]|nr:energy transducer TonB [Campylobacterota bacterium]